MSNEKFTLDEFIAAVKGSSGIKATIQRRLGCARMTVDAYLKRYVSAQAAYDEEGEVMGDVAESVVITAIKNKDVEAAKWYLVKKHRDRGYGDKNTNLNVQVDMSALPDEIIDKLARGEEVDLATIASASRTGKKTATPTK